MLGIKMCAYVKYKRAFVGRRPSVYCCISEVSSSTVSLAFIMKYVDTFDLASLCSNSSCCVFAFAACPTSQQYVQELECEEFMNECCLPELGFEGFMNECVLSPGPCHCEEEAVIFSSSSRKERQKQTSHLKRFEVYIQAYGNCVSTHNKSKSLVRYLSKFIEYY